MPESRFRSVLLYVLLMASLVVLPAAQSYAADSPGILIYKLPASAVKPAPAETEVVLAVEIGGAAVATQTVRVPPEDPPRDRLIEVLAGQPEARADVERRLRDGAKNAALVVRVDGKQYQRLTWSELLAATAAEIPTEAVSPQSLAAAAAMTPQQQCYQRCNDEYDACERTCEPYSGPNACWDCRTQLDACASFCTSCPRRWRTVGPWTEASRQTTGVLQCFVNNAFTTVRIYEEFQQKYQRLVNDFTENCDHSVTRVTTTEYRFESCWKERGFFCSSQVDVFGNRKKCP